jgi:hypothetical protein
MFPGAKDGRLAVSNAVSKLHDVAPDAWDKKLADQRREALSNQERDC